jgi:oxygen-independent coproporphyrinogen III oxidase
VNHGEPATSVGPTPVRTDVGSNFVSNYPPYSFWSPEYLPAVERALDAPPRAAVPLGLYVHVPFCRKRCKFCYFKVFTDKNARQVDEYLEALEHESRMYAARPAIASRSVAFVYIGGGTPSFLSSSQLRRLFGALRAAFPWDAVEEVTFECEPGTLTRPKVTAIRELGVTRLSLGVESFDDAILAENGRAHLRREIERALPWIREERFDQVNIDLIAGMVGDTWDTWRDSVRRAIEVQPDSVTVYQMELPYNTIYSKSVLDGRDVAVADWPLKREWHDYAFRELEAAGYEPSSAYTMVRRGASARFVYRDALWRGADLVGIGLSSFSHVQGVHFQNSAGWAPYVTAIRAGRLAVERAFVPDEDERLTRETILQLKRGWIEPPYFREKFGVDVLERFGTAISGLVERGLADVTNGRLELTRPGLLAVDQLLPEFYAEKYRNSRYT